MTNSEVTLRPATQSDMAGVFEIHKYYTLETVITFKTVVTSEAEHAENLRSVQSQRLPYIVAVLSGCDQAEPTREPVLGYIYCSGFRSGKSGYRHTVELSLFCHPEHQAQGIGTLLLKKLLSVLACPQENKEWYEGGNARSEDQKVRQVLAVMAVDEMGRESGYGLKRWYERFGFEEVGHLKKVGRKFDRW
jgi:L-amino acid N-acyltransferase YncA